MTLREIDDKLLLDCYLKAIDFKLEEDFIDLLKTEILRRGLDFPNDVAN